MLNQAIYKYLLYNCVRLCTECCHFDKIFRLSVLQCNFHNLHWQLMQLLLMTKYWEHELKLEKDEVYIQSLENDESEGQFTPLYKELRADGSKFCGYFRMSTECFST